MITTWAISGIAMPLLMVLSAVMYQRRQSKNAQIAQLACRRIHNVLMLIQLMQKHRGLGAQHGGASALQREQIAHELDRRWSLWSQQFPEAAKLDALWPALRAQPADFSGHSDLIEQLLNVIALLELRISALRNSAMGVVAKRCRDLEDLARLRGLSARAANNHRCPIELEVPLRYLCLRLRDADFQNNTAAVKTGLHEINKHLLDARSVSITPVRCFEMLTPIIDAALDDVHQLIEGQLPAASRSSVPAAVIPKTDRQRAIDGRLLTPSNAY